MKIIFSLIIIAICSVCSAQVDDKKYDVNFENIKLKQALESLTKLSGKNFSYSENVIQVNRVVNYTARGQTMEQILDGLFEGSSIRFKILDNQIILYKKNGNFDRTKSFVISGYITEEGSGEALLGVNIYDPEAQVGTVTNAYGFYSITLPSDSHSINFSYVGYTSQSHHIALHSDTVLSVRLKSFVELGEFKVTALAPETEVNASQTGKLDIPIQEIKDIPAMMGEKDVLKTLQLMPGVSTGSEGQSGYHVRGGGSDQNLIILDDAPVYNAYHMFGFLSLFNGDAIKNVELNKAGFPAKYGGRLSSVLDINMKEGNKEEFHGEAGIGLTSSRMFLEGPLKKNKSAFLISARRTYLDLLIKPFLPKGYNFSLYFYDLTAKLNYDFGDKDKLYLSFYSGRDAFGINTDVSNIKLNAGINWGNLTGTMRWNHLINKRLFVNTSFIYSSFSSRIFDEIQLQNTSYKLRLFSGIRDLTLKSDFDYSPKANHSINFGTIQTYHLFEPRVYTEKNDFSGRHLEVKEVYNALEGAFYIQDDWRFNKKIRANIGLRASYFITGTHSYLRPEPRFSASYLFRPDQSFKLAYSRMNQYIHLLTNTGIGLPLDLWVPSTPSVGPQQSDQVALAYNRNFPKQEVFFTIEAYYKASNGVIGYRDGSSFISVDDPTQPNNSRWEDNVTSGNGKSYGIEVLLQKKVGKYSGWLAYTLSKSTLQFDEINNGEEFFATQDRRHDFSIVQVYRLNENITFSATWMYKTGKAVTLPEGEYYAFAHNPSGYGTSISNPVNYGFFISEYSARNQYRMPAYHRLDVAVKFSKKKRFFTRDLELSVYNLYFRQNPFVYYITTSDTTGRKLQQFSLFPFMVPSITYSIRF